MLAEIDFDESLQQTIDDVTTFVPKLVAAIVIFVIGWFIARFIRKIVERLLTRVNFDGLVDRSGLGSYIERAGYPDSGVLLAKILYWGLMLIVLKLTIGVFGDNPVQEALDGLVAFIPKLFVAIVIVIITGAVANVVRELVGGAVAHLSYDRSIVGFVGGVIWFIGGFAALDQLEVAEDVVDTLFQYSVGAFFLILVIKFGIGGIWSARDRFWPAVYDRLEADGATNSSGGGE
ncbi:MAG: hypothetical protein AAF548_18115 [Actinomycetota bacterium]